MLLRRRFLVQTAAAATLPVFGRATVMSDELEPAAGEGLFDWIVRTTGSYDAELYRRMLGAANEFKEGDAIVGVAAASDADRRRARQLLSQTTLAEIDAHPPLTDHLLEFINASLAAEQRRAVSHLTLGELKARLLADTEAEIHALKGGLSSDVIACVVRLMTNEELTAVGAKVFNPLPGTQIGARGYMGARVQPNSPTDNVDDIRFQVFDAFAYGVGDVLLGTNPVSSEPQSVAAVEAALRDILESFDLQDAMPHCVLSHIDVQAEVERLHPGSTALWFQSIAGNESANTTFDISIDKMVRHARRRDGRFGLYFETGQGADFTNGHGHGCDMVLLESRKYGFARALTSIVADAARQRDSNAQPWVHLNDVAGFIGPEVFRTREQLVRCCLEDIVMGKLHGLTIGLDVCSTLHMDVTLDDLGWCIEQIMPACPAYLMALPTRIDPMLGYLTTGYQDHVRIREQFGYRVNDRMQAFFRRLGVVDDAGQPALNFGNPSAVYLAYCREKHDARTDDVIVAEARTKIAEVRSRGVFIAEGHGARPSDLQADLDEQIHRIYDDAKLCIWKELEPAFIATLPDAVVLRTRSVDRTDYILHPVSGEHLSDESAAVVGQLRLQHAEQFNVQIVVSDGLNALAVSDGDQLSRLLLRLRRQLAAAGWKCSPQLLLVHGGRVRAGYRIGEQLFGGRTTPAALLHVIGERPGTGHRMLSIYMTLADGAAWGTPDSVDHNITRVVSGIATTALIPETAADDAVRILKRIRADR